MKLNQCPATLPGTTPLPKSAYYDAARCLLAAGHKQEEHQAQCHTVSTFLYWKDGDAHAVERADLRQLTSVLEDAKDFGRAVTLNSVEAKALLDHTSYWRGIAAAAAEVTSGLVTQFSPDGFGEWLGTNRWYFVKLGPLVLKHDGAWRYSEREETLEERKTYAHRTWQEALAALRKCVAPDEPACAETIEWVHKGEKP